jgi:hypothetical protein
VKDRKYVTVHLESVAAGESSTSAVAKNLLRKLICFKFLYELHFLFDYIVILKRPSLWFQTKQLFLRTTELHVKKTMASTESLKLSPQDNRKRYLASTLS